MPKSMVGNASKEKSPDGLQAMLEEALPAALNALLYLLNCDDPKIRAEARRHWRDYRADIEQDLRRLRAAKKAK